MKRLLYVAPALALIALSPKAVGILGPILLIGGLIFIHELGHFLMAKRMGMPVKEFAWGLPFGPFITFFHWRETAVGIRPLAPLGGYVMLAGYNPEEPDAEDPHGFLQQPFGKRMLFYSGGILANALATFVLLFAVNVDRARFPEPPLQVQVMDGSAAAAGGLQSGDILRRIGDLNLPPADWNDDIVPYIQKRAGTPIPVEITRGGQSLALTLTPRLDGTVGKLGIQPVPAMPTGPKRPLQAGDFATGMKMAARETTGMALMVLKSYGRLVTGRESVKNLGGPIAIAKLGSEAAKAGWAVFFFTCAFISMNLAILNALPIPFLDGGHMAILCFERLRGKDLAVPLKERILTGGLIFLASLMALVIALDLWRLKH